MVLCSECGIATGKIIRSKKYGDIYLCSKCYQNYDYCGGHPIVYPLPPYAHVIYNENGYPICHECGKAYKALMTHARQKHSMSEKEYKAKHGLDRKGLLADATREIKQKCVKKHYNKVVKKNLIIKGTETRFVIGSKGRAKNMCSPQTLLRLKEMGSKKE